MNRGEGLRPRGQGGGGGCARSGAPALGEGTWEGGAADCTEPVRFASPRDAELSSPSPSWGRCGAVVSSEGFHRQVTGEVGGVPIRDRTGEAQLWGHLAQRRVGATPSEDTRLAWVWSGSPLPPSLPRFLNAYAGLFHTGVLGCSRWGELGLPPARLSTASDRACACGFCRGQRGFVHIQGDRACGKHGTEMWAWPQPCGKPGVSVTSLER